MTVLGLGAMGGVLARVPRGAGSSSQRGSGRATGSGTASTPRRSVRSSLPIGVVNFPIHVLDRGKVIEHGGHDELMSAHGRHRESYILWATAYTDPVSEA